MTKGVSISIMKDALGHTNYVTTAKYLGSLNDDRINKELQEKNVLINIYLRHYGQINPIHGGVQGGNNVETENGRVSAEQTTAHAGEPAAENVHA